MTARADAPRAAWEAARSGGRYLARTMAQSLRLMVGLPDYDAYLTHHESRHPGQPAMSYEEFFRNRLEARYGGRGGGRCC